MQVDHPISYRTISSNAIGDETVARAKHERGLDLMAKCEYQEAEQCFHEALIEDVSFGPAHNSLGKLYYDQKKFYLSAWEFEYAIKTMPNRPEPYNNLGLVMESIGQMEIAVENYFQAMELDPENPQLLGNFLRAKYRDTGFTEDLRSRYEELILLDDRPDWVDWARGVLSKNHPEIRSTANISGQGQFSDDRPTTQTFEYGETHQDQDIYTTPLDPILNGHGDSSPTSDSNQFAPDSP